MIGYRGTGKSTVARLLAEALGWDWVDADAELEARSGRSIRSIFAEEGEQGFRDREEAVLEDLCARNSVVVATGGGVVLRESNRQRLRAACRVVWLTADADTICRRLAADPSTAERRPALTGAAGACDREEVEELLRQREPFYRACADAIVDTAHHSPEEVVRGLLDLFRIA
ncbi:MAG: shikimate kinase [Planctomycetes bacterium]|nr:shikimate kinase [Planctomycetota bacterium]